MEVNGIFDPSFLDDLMESSSIVGSDVELGMSLDPVFASKESPSHESDSGCSDMFEDRSVSADDDLLSPVGMVNDAVELFDFGALTDDAELDNELAGYLGAEREKNDSKNIDEMSPAESPEIDVTLDSDDSNDHEYVPERRIIQSKSVRGMGKAVVPQANIISAPSNRVAKQDIRILQATACNSRSTRNNVNPPAVKVVKVIKTAARSKTDVDSELMKALDERNKKNAIQAKVNREKKKAYVKSLEDEIEELKSENAALKKDNEKYVHENKDLVEEVEYLRSVLANESALAGILKNIGNVENVKLSSSVNRKRNAGFDHDYSGVPSKRARATKTAGVCVHVDKGTVSLEFCSKCATMSKASSEGENS